MALSRPKRGFESRWGRTYFLNFRLFGIGLLTAHLGLHPFEQSAVVPVKGLLNANVLQAAPVAGVRKRAWRDNAGEQPVVACVTREGVAVGRGRKDNPPFQNALENRAALRRATPQESAPLGQPVVNHHWRQSRNGTQAGGRGAQRRCARCDCGYSCQPGARFGGPGVLRERSKSW